jgi:hypothetical protein
VLDANGGEVKAKASKWFSYHLRILKIVELELLIYQNTLIVSCCQKMVSCGENVWLWEKGGVFESLINFSWNTSLYASISVFDLEIGNWIRFAKTNQVVAKNDPNMSNLVKDYFCSQLHWCCTSICCFLMCWHKSPKRGRLKGKCALGPFQVYFGD